MGFTSDKMNVRGKTADKNAHPIRNMKFKHEKDRIQLHSCASTVRLCGTSLGAQKDEMVSGQQSGHQNCLTGQDITTSWWYVTDVHLYRTDHKCGHLCQVGYEMRSMIITTRSSFYTRPKRKLVWYKPDNKIGLNREGWGGDGDASRKTPHASRRCTASW